MYRPEIKVLDCTIRDGGLMNNHQFSNELVRKVYQAANDAGIDYIELGYKADESQFPRSEYGPMKFCSEKDIEAVVDGIEKKVKISVMADILYAPVRLKTDDCSSIHHHEWYNPIL